MLRYVHLGDSEPDAESSSDEGVQSCSAALDDGSEFHSSANSSIESFVNFSEAEIVLHSVEEGPPFMKCEPSSV